MRSTIRHIAFMLLTALPLRAGAAPADSSARADSGKVYRLDEIVVTAERYPVSPRKAGAVSYGAQGNGSAPFAGAGEALSGMRNLNVTSYGGGMALQTLSIRGMGAEHTLVLWNGMPAGNMQTGLSDINLFDASVLEAIRVVPGGGSALHGSAAVGGTVNLIPAIPYGGGRSVELSTATGSFGETDVSIRAEASPDSSFGFSVGAGSRRSSEEYPFGDPSTGGEHTRTNADFLNRSLSVAGGWKSSGRGRIGIILSALSLHQGAPAYWSPGSAGSSAARRSDERTLAGVSVEQYPSGALSVAATALFDRQYERYTDPDPLFPADNYYRTAWGGVSGQVRYRASPGWLLQAGTDLSLSSAAGNGIDRPGTRRSLAMTGSASWELNVPAPVSAVITASGRFDAISSSVPHFSPKLGLNAEITGNGGSARLHATAGSGRRSPTMNELYYSGAGGVGNPSLKNESSVSFDAGAGWSAAFAGGISGDVTWYRISMSDRIQWVPTEDPWVWTPENIGRSLSTGWEFSAEWTPYPGELEVHADYSTINAKRGSVNPEGTITYAGQLIHVPLNKGSVGVLLGRRGIAGWLRSVSLFLGMIHTGERYVLDDQSASLPAHRIIDATATAEFALPGGTITVVYAPRNLGNLDRQELPGYPMPRFRHSLSVTYRVHY